MKLREAALAGRLPAARELIGTDWESFVRAPEIQLNYATAAFWVRFLIDGDGGRHAAGFRAFLAAVAGGEPPDAETLQADLGRSGACSTPASAPGSRRPRRRRAVRSESGGATKSLTDRRLRRSKIKTRGKRQ